MNIKILLSLPLHNKEIGIADENTQMYKLTSLFMTIKLPNTTHISSFKNTNKSKKITCAHKK